MEKLQGPFNPSLFGQDLDVSWLEEFVSNIGNNYKFEDSYNEEVCDDTTHQSNHLVPSLEDKIPFLQMLQGIEPSQLTIPFIQQQSVNPKMICDRPITPSIQEPNYFQLLLRLQQHQDNFTSNFTTPFELETCMTNINKNDMVMDLNPPIKTETVLVKTPSPPNDVGGGVNISAPKERKKRKRSTKVTKNKEEVETQRMTHIAVERNRRRQMNEHLNALRSLMPPSYVQRGDQASIIGGAIDFVKEMEQLLESLQAQKRMRQQPEENTDVSTTSSTSSSPNMLNNMFITSPTSPFQLRNFSPNEEGIENPKNISRNNNNEEFSAENRSALADIKVIVIQNHVNLKIHCQRRPSQLLKAILAFEELRLTILHLNITSSDTLVHYSFNLKIEDDCSLGSADEVVRAVHHIFSLINLN